MTPLRILDWLTHNCSTAYDIAIDFISPKSTWALFGPDACSSLAEHIRPEAVALLKEDGLCTATTSAAAPPVEKQPGGGIAWNEPISHAGTSQRVCGPLAGDGHSGDDVFLDLGRDYPDAGRFQIVIWDVGGIDPIAIGSTLCTSGLITVYNGVAQIELRSPSQVEIYK